MSDQDTVNQITEGLKDKAAEITNPAPRRVFVKIERPHLLDGMRFLKKNLGFTHLSTITGLDRGEYFEMLYHLANETVSLTVRTAVPRTDPVVPSVCEVIPGAVLYEREIQDMFGVAVQGIPDGRRLLLSDDWPADQFPLRKDFKFDRPAEVIPGES
jgi:membrane-bound hydrogenase subunit beta